MTRVVCFLRAIERKSFLLVKRFLFIDDENSVTISLRFCDHVYDECCQQFSILVLIHLVLFFQIGMKGDRWLYIKVILQVTTRYFFCLLLMKLLSRMYFLSHLYHLKMVQSIGCTPESCFQEKAALRLEHLHNFFSIYFFQRGRGV